MIEMIPEERAFFISELDAVVIADLHIGYEEELRKEGINIPEQTERMMKRLREIIERKNAEKLIILGDVKHCIGKCNMIKILETLPVEIIITKGNHDGDVEKMLNGKIYDSTGFRIGNFGFMHGHSWPAEDVMRAKYVFMGHIHPEITLTDSVGKKHRYPCHLVGKLTKKGREKYGSSPKIFVLAAFNPLVGSSISEPLGPLLKNEIIGDFDVYLLNGTYLGKMEALQH